MNEKDKLMDHDYDGIQEYDNPLPTWWLGLFCVTIIFAVVYYPYYHLGGGTLPHQEYDAEIAEIQQKRAALATSAANTETAAAPIVTSGDAEAGHSVFVANCVPCHGQLGEGIIGPNLTDSFWLHGGQTENLIQVVTNGVPEKGMLAWGAILGPEKIRNVVAYVKTLKGTNPPNSKAPQGQEYPE